MTCVKTRFFEKDGKKVFQTDYQEFCLGGYEKDWLQFADGGAKMRGNGVPGEELTEEEAAARTGKTRNADWKGWTETEDWSCRGCNGLAFANPAKPGFLGCANPGCGFITENRLIYFRQSHPQTGRNP